jgi:hypothetical protein
MSLAAQDGMNVPVGRADAEDFIGQHAVPRPTERRGNGACNGIGAIVMRMDGMIVLSRPPRAVRRSRLTS